MTRTAKQLEATTLQPSEAAARLVAAHRGDRRWLNEFAEHLDRERAAGSLARIMSVWQLSQSRAGQLFGVSRQALHKWLSRGVPTDRVRHVADLAAATDLLVHYLQRDRISAVVRRPIAARSGVSLIDLVAAGESRAVLEICREMFDFEGARL